MKTKLKFDIWSLFKILIIFIFVLFLIYPILSLLIQSVYIKGEGFSIEYFSKFFGKSYYFGTLINSIKVSLSATLVTILIGVPLAYFFSMYKIVGAKVLRIFIILSSMSAPFIGAYSWVLLLGRNGIITKLLSSTLGIKLNGIYGFGGILLVFACQLYPLIFLYAEGAFGNMDNSLMEASESMGCKGVRRFFKIILPVILPTILSGTLLVFMRSLADFGTPMLIGEGYKTFPQLIYTEFVGEIGSNSGFASAISVIAIIFTTLIFLVQKKISEKNSYQINFLNPVSKKSLKGYKNILVHLFCYLVVAISIMPQIYLIYSSFRNTSGLLFVDGHSFMSYKEAFSRMGGAIKNTILFPFIALIIIVFLAILISYIVVRRKNTASNLIDVLAMIPYIVPGIVVGIALLNGFSTGIMGSKILVITGSATIIIVSFVIRRLPYTIRSSTATLQNIPLSIEEAALSLGCNKMKSFFKVTVPIMRRGIISGAILSYITLISELSTSILLTNLKTKTMTVAIYTEIIRGNYGIAAALSTMLTLVTAIALIIFTIVSDKKTTI